MEIDDFKYSKELKEAEKRGAVLPSLSVPNDTNAYRFVFSNNIPNSYIPIYLMSPKRATTAAEKNELKTSGYALSLFNTEDNAQKEYAKLCATCRNIKLTIGDTVSYGVLTSKDGMISKINSSNGHFDLYEFKGCDLAQRFTLLEDVL